MSDLLLFQTNDGGEIEVINGFVTLTDDLQTASYLSMFGGDSWFANDLQENPASKMNAETGRVIETTNPSSSGLLAVEDAIKRDHAWMITEGLASAVDAEANLDGSTLTIIINITYDTGDTVRLNFELNWSVAA